MSTVQDRQACSRDMPQHTRGIPLVRASLAPCHSGTLMDMPCRRTDRYRNRSGSPGTHPGNGPRQHPLPFTALAALYGTGGPLDGQASGEVTPSLIAAHAPAVRPPGWSTYRLHHGHHRLWFVVWFQAPSEPDNSPAPRVAPRSFIAQALSW